jgi:hypothetical protein
MKTHARTPLQSKAQRVEKTAMTTAPATAAALATDERVQRRQLERSVSLTGPERLRYLWYRLRLTVAEMNYATRRLTELQTRLP